MASWWKFSFFYRSLKIENTVWLLGLGIELLDATFLWSRDTWLGLHNWIAVALLVIVILHLVLHWRWIVYMTRAFWAQKNNQEGLVGKE